MATPRPSAAKLPAAAPAGLLSTNRLANVLSEIARQRTWSATSTRLYRYRDRYEVDTILEGNAGRIIGIEIKAAETVRPDDSLSFGTGLTCVPISALWTEVT